MHQDLLLLRKEWYASFAAGDVRRSREIQSCDFTLLGTNYSRDRAMKIPGVAEARQGKLWFPAGTYVEDMAVQLQSIGTGVMGVYSSNRIVTPYMRGPMVICTEIWHKTTLNWQLVHFHFHEASGDVLLVEKNYELMRGNSGTTQPR